MFISLFLLFIYSFSFSFFWFILSVLFQAKVNKSVDVSPLLPQCLHSTGFKEDEVFFEHVTPGFKDKNRYT